MKLAFCLYKYFPYGGLQRDFLRIAKKCIENGHTVDVYTMSWQGPFMPGLAVHTLKVHGWLNHTKRRAYMQQLQRFLAQHAYDLVVGFNKMPGLDVYYAADTCYQAKARKQHYFWYRLTGRYRASIADEKSVFAKEAKTEILLISKLQQAEFEQYYQTPPARFHLLPPGIDSDRIAPTNAADIRNRLRKELGLGKNALMLLMVGSGFKTKGLDRLLRAVAALPQQLKNLAQVYIIGQDHPESFQILAKRLHIADKIHFLGGRDDVPRYFLAADLLLHPAYNENTGTVLLEALVSGLPVLTTDVCGYAHYVNEAQAGIVLSSPFSQEQMNKTLVDMLMSSERSTWQKNALAFANKADIYSMPERAVEFIESLR